MPYDGLPKKLWSPDFHHLDIQESQFIDIINYALTSFHLHCRSPDLLLNNHEQTYFVEHIIPGLLALSKTSGLIQFRWCELEMQAIKAINLKDNDYNAKKAPQRFLDALGVMTSSMEMEAVIVEASSSGNSENVGPTIEDTVKILECATSSLVHQQSKYKNASIETFKKLRVFSIHVIKNKITLSSTMLCDRYRWNHIELRSATIPSTWTHRLELLKYFELLATLMVCIENA
ncbi:hypothetical protein BDC45DRAFT_439245 [Circinella umbellata]|nr:hypothetical protein BDC45DRAFT_439245 [Circinella umbellata]